MKKKIGVFIVVAVLVCAISMPIFGANLQDEFPTENQSWKNREQYYCDGQFKVWVGIATTGPYIPDFSYDNVNQGTSSTNSYYRFPLSQDFIINIYFRNDSEHYIVYDNYFFDAWIRFGYPSGNNVWALGYEIKDYTDNATMAFTNSTQGAYTHSLRIYPDDSTRAIQTDGGILSKICIAPYSVYEFKMVVTCHYYVSATTVGTTSITTSMLSDYAMSCETVYIRPDLNWTVNDNVTSLNNDYNIHEIEQNTQAILDAYTSNSANAQAVTDGTQSNDQTLAGIGQNEDTWFTQNNQALQSTGINNFDYSPTVMSGMSAISDKFTQLWLAIGDWNFVYTFSMMIGLVMLILRHAPQRRKGGGKNASSS